MRRQERKFHFSLCPRILLRTATLVILSFIELTLSAPATASVPPGIWLMDSKVAIQIFDCSGMLCGRVIWLKAPLDAQGLLKRDKLNPNPELRERQVCGPTIIWNAHYVDPRWRDGWFYNPDDGATYRVAQNLQSDDVIVARVYVGIPIFGETKTLIRVPMGIGAGWC
jgi:uncharacterized protein (DUF2147 family)